MPKTLGCEDLGFDCPWRVVAEEGQEDLVVASTVEHAKLSHPELAQDVPQLSSTLNSHIRNLYQQAGFDPEADTISEER